MSQCFRETDGTATSTAQMVTNNDVGNWLAEIMLTIHCAIGKLTNYYKCHCKLTNEIKQSTDVVGTVALNSDQKRWH